MAPPAVLNHRFAVATKLAALALSAAVSLTAASVHGDAVDSRDAAAASAANRLSVRLSESSLRAAVAPALDVQETSGEHLCQRSFATFDALPPVREHWAGSRPRLYDWAMPIATVGCVLTAAISLPHLWQLVHIRCSPAFPSRLRMTRIVAAAPLAMAMFKLAAILAPRFWRWFFFSVALYEVVVFYTFLHLLFSFVTGIDGDTSDEKLLESMQASAPAKIWAVVPFGLCFKPCTTPRPFDAQDLRIVRCLMFQFVVITIGVAATEWTEAVEQEKVRLRLSQLETLSLMGAMYSLFAILFATHDRLHHYRSHSKFWAIKGTFIANMMMFRIARVMVHDDVRVGSFCYTAGTLAAAGAGMVTTMFAVPLALLSWYAYPVSESLDADHTAMSGPGVGAGEEALLAKGATAE